MATVFFLCHQREGQRVQKRKNERERERARERERERKRERKRERTRERLINCSMALTQAQLLHIDHLTYIATPFVTTLRWIIH